MLFFAQMKSIIFLLLATFFWAMNFYWGKMMLAYVSPEATALWRYFFGVLVLLLLSLGNIPTWSSIRKNSKGLLLVGISLGVFIWFFFQGLNYTSEMNGALLVSLNPALTLLLLVIFKSHKIKPQEVLGIIIAFAGVAYLLTKGNLVQLLTMEHNFGDLIMLAGVLVFAMQNIWVKEYAHQLGHLIFTFYTSLICLVLFIPFLLIQEHPPLSSLPSGFWLPALGTGILGTALAYYCWNYGISKMGAAKAVVFINLVPLFAALFAILLGAEIFAYHGVSAVMIIAGLLLIQVKRGPVSH